MRSPDLFPAAPRRPRRVMMHVVDAGLDVVLLECGKCGHQSGWVPYRQTPSGQPSVSLEKRGRPCPKCNNLADDGELTMGDF